jgi:membrane protein YdbS with pleckstrin-like domain
MWAVTAAVEGAAVVAVLALAGPVAGWLPVPWWAVVLVLVIAVAYVAVVPSWRYAVHRWEVTDTAVYTQTGWWARERRIAPMSRIQTVDHVEGAIARLFGLSTVTVTTASAAGALEIAGLDRSRALALVDELTLMADSVPGDAT